MKKIITLVLLAFIGFSTAAFAESNEAKIAKEHTKMAEKIAKQRAKELKKEKWIFNGASSLEAALCDYLLQTDKSCGGNKRGQVYDINNAASLSLGDKRLLMDAQTHYIQEVQAEFSANIAVHAGQTNDTPLEAYIADVEARIAGEVRGEVHNAFTIYRKNSDGTFSVRGFFIIDVNEAAIRLNHYADQIENNEKIADAIRRAAHCGE